MARGRIGKGLRLLTATVDAVWLMKQPNLPDGVDSTGALYRQRFSKQYKKKKKKERNLILEVKN